MTAVSGVAAAIAAAFGWAFYDLARRALTARMTAWALVAWVTIGALPLLGLWAVLAGDLVPRPGYAAPALASVALNVAANFGYFRAFQLSPMSVTLPMLSFTPLFASLLGAAFLGEEVSARAAAGALLVVFGGLALGLRPGGLRIESGSAVMLGVAFCWSATLLLDKAALAAASPQLHALVLNGGVAVGIIAGTSTGGGQDCPHWGHFQQFGRPFQPYIGCHYPGFRWDSVERRIPRADGNVVCRRARSSCSARRSPIARERPAAHYEATGDIHNNGIRVRRSGSATAYPLARTFPQIQQGFSRYPHFVGRRCDSES